MGFSKEQEQVFSEAHRATPRPHLGLCEQEWVDSQALRRQTMTYSKGHQQSRASRKAATYSQKSTAQKKNTRCRFLFVFAFLICIRQYHSFPTFLKLTGSFHKVIIYHISCQLCLKLRLYFFQSLSVLPANGSHNSLSSVNSKKERNCPLIIPTKFSHY